MVRTKSLIYLSTCGLQGAPLVLRDTGQRYPLSPAAGCGRIEAESCPRRREYEAVDPVGEDTGDKIGDSIPSQGSVPGLKMVPLTTDGDWGKSVICDCKVSWKAAAQVHRYGEGPFQARTSQLFSDPVAFPQHTEQETALINQPLHNTSSATETSLHRQHTQAKMRISITTIMTAALGPAGAHCITDNFLKSCTNVALTNLEGEPGRSIMLQAYCDPLGGAWPWTELDLNTCFGWNAEWCEFEGPAVGASHFTDRCANCSDHPSHGEDPPFLNLWCFCTCFGQRDIHMIFFLGRFSLTLFLAPSFSNARGPFSCLTRAWQIITLEMIGGNWSARGGGGQGYGSHSGHGHCDGCRIGISGTHYLAVGIQASPSSTVA